MSLTLQITAQWFGRCGAFVAVGILLNVQLLFHVRLKELHMHSTNYCNNINK